MKKSIIAAPVLTLLALAGCASAPSQQDQEATVAYKVTSPPLFPGQIPLVINQAPSLRVGGNEKAIGLFSLRECNSDKTDCKVGQGKVDAYVKVVSLGAESATVQVALNMDIGAEQTAGGKSKTASMSMSRSLSKDLPILTDNQSLTKMVDLPYGAIGRIDMKHGVTFRMCVLTKAAIAASGCSGKEVVLASQ
ncbi:hypothetical protein SJI00_21135 [Pseudomonas sp. RP23018S]|uniref:hypothetical protein n=1 Tax=Pseudomonas sp. RP23018S TaxID=3096037 RepID=UPI002ACAA2F4|nr:hypothetical protein [Pseudomonas sp. RP23018S]MDZ5605282.1 hypothetical protein [Pseudomonas sp. RP23018S]